jgi:hypothetical protein
MSGLTMSPKHGVNATVPICFWCGETKDEIAFLGRLKEDMEAPNNLVLDYKPCDKCNKGMKSGITLILVSHTPIMNGQEPINKREKLYPTGSWKVITEDAAKRIFNSELLEDILKDRRCLMDQVTWDFIFKEVEDTKEESGE